MLENRAAIQGEWFIDDSGNASFADGDIGDMNHEMLALEAMIPDEYLLEKYRAQEFESGEPLTPEDRQAIEAIAPGALSFLEGNGSAMEWMIYHHNWIRVHGHNFELNRIDPDAINRIANFLGEEGGYQSFDEFADLDDEITVEDGSGHFTNFTVRQIFEADSNPDAMSRLIFSLNRPHFAQSQWRFVFGGELGYGEINRNVEEHWDRGGISSTARDYNFVPAFRDRHSGKVFHDPRFAMHDLAAVPEEYWLSTDINPNPYGGGPYPVAVSDHIEDGFLSLRDGKFYTREQVSQIVERSKTAQWSRRFAQVFNNLHWLLSGPNEDKRVGHESGEAVRDGVAVYDDPYGSRRYVRYYGGQAVAGLQVMRNKNQAIAANIFTHPDFRRKGYALELMHRAKIDFPHLVISEDRSESGAGLVQKFETLKQAQFGAFERNVSFYLLKGDLVMSPGYHEEYLMKNFGLKKYIARALSYVIPRGSVTTEQNTGEIEVAASAELEPFKNEIIQRLELPTLKCRFDFNDAHYRVVDSKKVLDMLEGYLAYDLLDRATIQFIREYIPQVYEALKQFDPGLERPFIPASVLTFMEKRGKKWSHDHWESTNKPLGGDR